jgi:hypothetical protein
VVKDDREHLAMMEKICGVQIRRNELPWVEEVLHTSGMNDDNFKWQVSVRSRSLFGAVLTDVREGFSETANFAILH